MSGIEIVAAVSAVVSAFHGGAELVKHIRKKRSKRRHTLLSTLTPSSSSSQIPPNTPESALFEALQAGGHFIDTTSKTLTYQLGEAFTRGDAIAQSELERIHMVMKAEILLSLQMGIDIENAVVDLNKLRVMAYERRIETLDILTELKQRLVVAMPLRGGGNMLLGVGAGMGVAMPSSTRGGVEPWPRSIGPSEQMESWGPRLHKSASLESVDSFKTAYPELRPDTLPSAVTIPDAPEASRGGSSFGRFLSIRGSGRRDQQHRMIEEAPPPVPAIPQGYATQELPGSYAPYHQQRGASVDQHLIQDLTSLTLNGQPHAYQDDILTAASSTPPRSYRDSNSTQNSSQRPWPQHAASAPDSIGRNGSTSTNGSSSLRAASAAATAGWVTDRSDRRSTMSSDSSGIAPDGPPIKGFHPGYDYHSRPDMNQTIPGTSWPRKHQPFKSSTIMTPPSSGTSLLGRPDKGNNYWGFCKGAWGCQEGVAKGMKKQTRPAGRYSTVEAWECRYCSFQGDVFSQYKPAIDPRVNKAACRIQYRWIFLAKSHAKKKPGNVHYEGSLVCNYGCIFCCSEGKETSIFGNVETLMNHIFSHHSDGITQDMQERLKCIFGRVADSREDFDINIPNTPELAGEIVSSATGSG